ncbi:MAG: NlpC/P60 family protein [Firmicutes bacterium]|nr:NlpC/P60 family protein [Bacillota bacterium]
MKRYKLPIILILLVAFTFMATTPVLAAPGLADLLGNAGAGSITSGGGIVNILLGLILGKLFGNITDTASSAVNTNKVLGASTSISSEAANSPIITAARKYMGVPYVWGGVTPDGFDCSGFTQYVMKENGITLPRTAAEQFAIGTAVEKADLNVGDLIFFTTYKPGASHVGFYIGNGQFIHASSVAAKVTISNLNDTYYVEHYIGARRYK